MTVREIVSNLARLWRDMDDVAKEPFAAVAVIDKKRSDDERAVWLASGREFPKRRKKQKRKNKKETSPNKRVKRVSSAYIFFSMVRPLGDNFQLYTPSRVV